jgi:hypothetical protein
MSNLLKDANGNESSKRVFGAIGISLFYIMSGIIAFYSVYTGNDIGVNAVNLISGVGYTGTALLLGGVIEHFAKGKDK